MRLAWVSVAAAAGCSFRTGTVSNGQADARVWLDGSAIQKDAPKVFDDAPPAFCFGSQTIDRTCFGAIPSGTLSLTANTAINTDTYFACTATLVNGVVACAIGVATFSVGNSKLVAVTGARPLVIVATTSITITGPNGVFDISGHGMTSGAGARGSTDTACITNTTPPTHGGGGWGGAGQGSGGLGGDEQDMTGTVVGMGARPAAALTAPTQLLGGCLGGGTVAASMNGGGGGGVVAFISPMITIGGTVAASGGGGRGGIHGTPDGGGGGGGGAGGLIILDGATFLGAGSLIAQGGGGGEGGDAADSLNGSAGIDGFAANNAGAGGNGSTNNGGAAGSGATGTTVDGTGASAGGDSAGGGGGGGAAGFIIELGTGSDGSLQTSPTPG